MKSAYELAMSRLEKEKPAVRLSDAQKKQLAEIDSLSTAKMAERRIFLESKIREAEASGLAAEAEEIRRELAREIRRLEEERDAKKEKIRAQSA